MRAVELWVLMYAANALWQLPAIAAAAWCGAWLLRWSSPTVLHRLWVAALVAECVVPAWLPRWVGTALRALFPQLATHASAGLASITFDESHALNGVALSAGVLAAVTALYGAAVVYAATRLVTCLLAVRRLRRGVSTATVLERVTRSWAECAPARNLAGVVLAESGNVASPVTFGTWPA